jgi:ketosteroid isomerase-like protein
MAPSGAGRASLDTNLEVVRAFVDAFNAEDLDALVALCDPEVEVQTRSGVVIGHEELREWATRNPHGDLHQRLLLDSMREDEHRRHVLAFVRREWFWRDANEVADAEDIAILATIREGRIVRWQPFEDRDEGLSALAGEA